MKRGFYIVLSVLTIIVGISCSNTKSYTDMLNDQRDVIDRFIDENGIVVLNDYPTDRLMKPNEFVNINGIYMNVIDSGRGDKVQYGDIVYCRYEGYYLMGDSGYVNLFRTGQYPDEMRFGYTGVSQYVYYLCPGMEISLSILRDSAEVKLIVPFQYGTYYAQTNGYPFYFERVKYLLKK